MATKKQAKKTIFKFRQHSAKRLSGQAGTFRCRHSMRQKFVFTPFYQMLHPRDRQKRLPFFYRNNTEKYGCIVPNIVPNIVLDIVPIMCYTIPVKMYVGDRYAKNDEYKRGGKPLEYQ